MNKINIIIPTYNEDKNILSLIMKIKKYLPNAKICIVDDTKKNIIGTILKKNNLHKIIYFHRKKKGRGSAVIFGFKKLFILINSGFDFKNFNTSFSEKLPSLSLKCL